MALRVTFLFARAQVLTLCQLDPTPSYLPGLRCRVDANMAEQESATNLENMQESLCTLEFPGVFLPVMIVLQSQNMQAGGTVRTTDVLPRKVRISQDFSSSRVVYGSRNRRTTCLKSELNGSCIHYHCDYFFFILFFL